MISGCSTRRLMPSLCAALFAINAAGCQRHVVTPLVDSGASYTPAATWRTAEPAAAGLDAGRMAALHSDVAAGRYGAIHAVLVIRFGHLVHDQYLNWNPTTAHTLQSVSKSVTALLYGTLAGNELARLDRRVVDVFARYSPIGNSDTRKDALRIRDLLTMRAAMNYWEQPYPSSPHDSLNRSSGDWTRFILDRPMTGMPDGAWSYNSGAAILTCSAIREITGESVKAYAKRTLFEPIGIASDQWAASPHDGLPHCGGGLYLTPADLARIGYFTLRKGKWGDRQIVPSAWITEMTQPYSTGSPLFFSSFGSSYGYFWWLFPEARGGAGTGVWAASGSGGQWLFVVPSHDLVVVVAGTDARGLDLLYDGVLPAVRD
jgi:CubicO group peptidase (beta-lactamase class C family)